MTVISESVDDIAGADNTTTFEFCRVRPGPSGTGLLTGRSRVMTATEGVLTTPDLAPGETLVRIGIRTYLVEIPDSETPIRLSLLLADAPPPTAGAGYVTLAYADATYALIGEGGGGGPVDWDDITDKPTTFAPTIGSTGSTAVAGNDARLTDARTPTSHTHPATGISDSTSTGRAVLTAADAAAARTAIGAGTSSLALGTSGSTAKVGDYQPTAANISDSTTVGRAVVTAADAAAARTAIGAGTSSLALGTSGSTAKVGDYQPAAANISDSTTVGRAVLTAADAAAARTATGAVGTADTQTLTNKRVTKRIGTTASSATPTPDADAHDQYNITALAAGATFAVPSGTPTDGQRLMIRIKDNGTARTLAWNAIYRALGITLPTTTVISKTLYLGMVYNAADTRWDVLAVGQEA